MRNMCGLVMGLPFALFALGMGTDLIFTVEMGMGFTFCISIWENVGRWLRLGWRLGFGLGAGVAFTFPCFTFTMKAGRIFAVLGRVICGWMRMVKAGFTGDTFTMKSIRDLAMSLTFNMKSADSPVADFLFTMESTSGLVAGAAFTFHTF